MKWRANPRRRAVNAYPPERTARNIRKLAKDRKSEM